MSPSHHAYNAWPEEPERVLHVLYVHVHTCTQAGPTIICERVSCGPQTPEPVCWLCGWIARIGLELLPPPPGLPQPRADSMYYGGETQANVERTDDIRLPKSASCLS